MIPLYIHIPKHIQEYVQQNFHHTKDVYIGGDVWKLIIGKQPEKIEYFTDINTAFYLPRSSSDILIAIESGKIIYPGPATQIHIHKNNFLKFIEPFQFESKSIQTDPLAAPSESIETQTETSSSQSMGMQTDPPTSTQSSEVQTVPPSTRSIRVQTDAIVPDADLLAKLEAANKEIAALKAGYATLFKQKQEAIVDKEIAEKKFLNLKQTIQKKTTYISSPAVEQPESVVFTPHIADPDTFEQQEDPLVIPASSKEEILDTAFSSIKVVPAPPLITPAIDPSVLPRKILALYLKAWLFQTETTPVPDFNTFKQNLKNTPSSSLNIDENIIFPEIKTFQTAAAFAHNFEQMIAIFKMLLPSNKKDFAYEYMLTLDNLFDPVYCRDLKKLFSAQERFDTLKNGFTQISIILSAFSSPLFKDFLSCIQELEKNENGLCERIVKDFAIIGDYHQLLFKHANLLLTMRDKAKIILQNTNADSQDFFLTTQEILFFKRLISHTESMSNQFLQFSTKRFLESVPTINSREFNFVIYTFNFKYIFNLMYSLWKPLIEDYILKLNNAPRKNKEEYITKETDKTLRNIFQAFQKERPHAAPLDFLFFHIIACNTWSQNNSFLKRMAPIDPIFTQLNPIISTDVINKLKKSINKPNVDSIVKNIINECVATLKAQNLLFFTDRTTDAEFKNILAWIIKTFDEYDTKNQRLLLLLAKVLKEPTQIPFIQEYADKCEQVQLVGMPVSSEELKANGTKHIINLICTDPLHPNHSLNWRRKDFLAIMDVLDFPDDLNEELIEILTFRFSETILILTQYVAQEKQEDVQMIQNLLKTYFLTIDNDLESGFNQSHIEFLTHFKERFDRIQTHLEKIYNLLHSDPMIAFTPHQNKLRTISATIMHILKNDKNFSTHLFERFFAVGELHRFLVRNEEIIRKIILIPNPPEALCQEELLYHTDRIQIMELLKSNGSYNEKDVEMARTFFLQTLNKALLNNIPHSTPLTVEGLDNALLLLQKRLDHAKAKDSKVTKTTKPTDNTLLVQGYRDKNETAAGAVNVPSVARK